jgi:hypothetical protein
MNKAVNSEQFQVTKTVKNEGTRSEKFGMNFCPNCSGSRNYFHVDRGVSGCNVCGGFGLIKVEMDRMVDENGAVQLLS